MSAEKVLETEITRLINDESKHLCNRLLALGLALIPLLFWVVLPDSSLIPGSRSTVLSDGPGSASGRVGLPAPSGTALKLPLSFEANLGQTDARVKFLSRGQGYTLFLTKSEAILNLPSAKGTKQETPGALSGVSKTSTTVRMKLVDSNPAVRLEGLDPLPGKSNYFKGNNPARWRTNVPHYARVQYRNVYPGVNLVYHGNQQELEYDFVLAPGADPGVIGFKFEGAQKLNLDGTGDLILHTQGGEIRQHKPRTYQEVNGEKREVSSRYVIYERERVGFEVANYDATRALVIDPVFSYATYLGGNSSETGDAIAVDAGGNAYVTGSTYSVDFPTTSGATHKGGSADVFVTKLNATGTALVYSTFLGGNSSDYAYSIAVDASGNAYVTGTTYSTNFPTSAGAFQTTNAGASDVFVTKLNPVGNALVYSTMLGGRKRISYIPLTLGGLVQILAGP